MPAFIRDKFCQIVCHFNWLIIQGLINVARKEKKRRKLCTVIKLCVLCITILSCTLIFIQGNKKRRSNKSSLTILQQREKVFMQYNKFDFFLLKF